MTLEFEHNNYDTYIEKCNDQISAPVHFIFRNFVCNQFYSEKCLNFDHLLLAKCRAVLI